MFTRICVILLFSPFSEYFSKFYSNAESKTTPDVPIDALSVVVGETVEFPCVKPSSWTRDSESASWVRMTTEDAKRCEKGLKKIKDDHHWFCDVLVGNRIVQSDFSERFSVGPLGSASENNLTLKSATLEDSGRYYCFNNRTKEIVKIYNLSVYCVTTTVTLETIGLRVSSTSSDVHLNKDSCAESSDAEVPFGLIFACLFAAVSCVLASVVCILMGKLRKSKREILKYRNSSRGDAEKRNFEEIEEPNCEEEAIEALNSNANNEDDLCYMELEKTRVNQPRVYETIALK